MIYVSNLSSLVAVMMEVFAVVMGVLVWFVSKLISMIKYDINPVQFLWYKWNI